MNRDQSSVAACNDDTVQKLRDLHPEISLDLNLDNLPTPEALAAFCDNGSAGWTQILPLILTRAARTRATS
jgi:hypothetical protein